MISSIQQLISIQFLKFTYVINYIHVSFNEFFYVFLLPITPLLLIFINPNLFKNQRIPKEKKERKNQSITTLWRQLL